MTKRRITTRPEIYEITKLLEKHVTRLSEGLCAYEAGWDDYRVLEELRTIVPSAAELSNVHVGNLRRELFGNTNQKAPAGTSDEARLKLVETKLGDALRLIADLTSKHDLLCKALSVARGGSVDARHLCIQPVGKGA